MTKQRAKMPVSERAKQFMPFKAVSGLDEALERKLLEWQHSYDIIHGSEDTDF